MKLGKLKKKMFFLFKCWFSHLNCLKNLTLFEISTRFGCDNKFVEPRLQQEKGTFRNI